jgi:predicted RNA-binding protein associated with RNAse of E/G family
MKEEVVVIKRNTRYQETWRYTGQVLRRYPRAVLLEALFNRDDTPFHGILLGRGDRFVEIYYTDRWYNIFEMHDREDDRVKGWYCNVSRPAELTDGQISYVDLALDLLVYPDGHMLVLDEDEFAALALDEATHANALSGLEALKRVLQEPGEFPFVETQDQ